MKKTIIRIFILLLFLSTAQEAKTQTWGIGGSGIYNLQSESLGFGFRMEFPMGRTSFVPQFNYYPGFGKIKEYYLGASLHLTLFHMGSWKFYILANGAYNRWINYEISPMENAAPNNWALEGGAGLTTSSCVRPFIEYRYNVKWQETNLRIGIMFFFGCKNGKRGGSGGRGGKKRKAVSCPAYKVY